MGNTKCGIQVRASTPTASARMARVRQSGTEPELVVRGAATRAGLHYRVSNRDLSGSPDLANRTRRWAIFVHGCFWHRHARCKRATTPKSNTEFWTAKFANNRRRDSRVIKDLRSQGYTVLVIWECETLLSDALSARVAKLISR